MSILFISSSGKLHETALSMEIDHKSTLNRHQVGELDSRIGTTGVGTTYILKAPKHIRSIHRSKKCKT